MSARAQSQPAPVRRYRARPAARRPAGGRRRTRVNWEKLGRRLLVCVLFAVLASYLNPIVNLVDDWRDSHAEQQHFTELRRENARLSARADALQDPGVAEREARRLGMIGPGERAYVIHGLPR